MSSHSSSYRRWRPNEIQLNVGCESAELWAMIITGRQFAILVTDDSETDIGLRIHRLR